MNRREARQQTPPELAGTVTPYQVREYAKSRGWKRVVTHRSEVAVYSSPTAGRLEQLIVPVAREGIDDYAERIADVVATLSNEEQRDPAQVLADLSAPESDTIRFGVDGSVSLPDGIQLHEGARRSILSAACSVVAPDVTHHPRLSRSEADLLLRASRLNHTERGEHDSFILSISCPLRAVASDLGEDPFTRRALLLLLRSADRLVRAIEADTTESLFGTDPEQPVLSANLCDALLRMQPPDRGTLQIGATWAPVLPLNGTPAPPPVRIKREYFEPIAAVYERLRPPDKPREDWYVGTVETLNGAMGDDGHRAGEVILLVLHEDELLRVRMNLRADWYAVAYKAHNEPGSYIQVCGVLQRGSRAPHKLQKVTDCRPVV